MSKESTHLHVQRGAVGVHEGDLVRLLAALALVLACGLLRARQLHRVLRKRKKMSEKEKGRKYSTLFG